MKKTNVYAVKGLLPFDEQRSKLSIAAKMQNTEENIKEQIQR